MKHILKVIEHFEFDHTKDDLIHSMSGFDFDRSQTLVEKSMKYKLASERIEYIMFGNTELLKIRIMAIYGLGLITGARRAKPSLHIKITEL